MSDLVGIAADPRLLDELTYTASRAAAAILAISRDALERRDKADRSPVTAADLASEAAILPSVKQLLPGLAVVSEESTTAPFPLGAQFVLVDPLDGTREFLAGRDEFTVNIAVVHDGRPLVGVVAAPARGLIWRGIVGVGAERLVLAPGEPPQAARDRRPIRTRPRPASGLIALQSRSHLDAATAAFLARINPAQRIPCGSALKFGLLAEGTADIYPRLAPTSEWDIAAGHAVLAAAGGAVTAPGGAPLRYGNPGFRVPAFVALGDPRWTP